MPNIQIVKYKIRRGTDLQRKSVILDQGELGFTTDTKRLFIGTGVLSGGTVIGSKIHAPVTNTYSLTTINAQMGDMVQANNAFYQLTATNYNLIDSWKKVSPKVDGIELIYSSDNTLQLQNASVSATKLNPSSISDGLKIDSGKLKTDIETSMLGISSNKLTIAAGGVRGREINSSALSSALVGGDGAPISVKYDPTMFSINGSNQLTIDSIPSASLTFDSIDSNWIGAGLIYDAGDEVIKSKVTSVDESLSLSLTGHLSLQSGLVSATNELGYITTDTYGRVLENQSSIYDTVSCLSAAGGGTFESLFNGSLNDPLSGGIPDLEHTIFTVLSSNSTGTVALQLSSAGFIMFEGGASARQDGKYISRFAIPIFTY